MSSEGSRVTSEHFDYVRARTIPEGRYLRHLKESAREAGIPEIWISPEQAALMQILLKLNRAREVVEVGTLAGYSAISMARALGPQGRVRTIELEPSYADFAEAQAAGSDVAGHIEVHRGDARDVLRGFADSSADAAFIDADKASYSQYLAECLRIVRLGGLIMVDNAFAFGQLFDERPTDPSVADVRAFNDHMARVPQVEAIIAPIGDGCWVGVKVAEPD